MKKIFTFFLGMIVALTAVAAPAKVAKKHEFRPVDKVASLKTLAKAPQALKEDADSISIVYEEDRYIATYGIYVYILVDAEGTEYYFSFDSEGTDPVVNGQTYTLSDMNSDYSYLYIEGYGGIGFESASFTKTVDGEGNVMIVVDFSLGEGYDFHLVYDSANLPEAPEGGNFELDGCDANFFVDTLQDQSLLPNIQYILTSEEDQLTIYLDIKLVGAQQDVVSGQVYTQHDMIDEYTAAYFGVATQIEMDTISFVKNETENGVTIQLYFKDSRGFEWNLTYSREMSDMTFEFVVTDEDITITPSNDEDPWDYAITTQEQLNQNFGGSIDEFAAAAYAYYGSANAAPGEYTVTFEELQAQGISGEVILVVYGADAVGVTTAAASVVIEVPAVEPSENQISLAFDETTQKVVFTTTNDDDYFVWIETLDKYNSYQADFSQESLNAETDDWLATVSYRGSLDSYLFSGNMELDITEAVSGEGDYVILVAPAAGAVRNGDAIYLQFHYGAQEGIEEVLAAGKAAKVVRDGQVLILKGDKVFNAFGAQLK